MSRHPSHFDISSGIPLVGGSQCVNCGWGAKNEFYVYHFFAGGRPVLGHPPVEGDPNHL